MEVVTGTLSNIGLLYFCNWGWILGYCDFCIVTGLGLELDLDLGGD